MSENKNRGIGFFVRLNLHSIQGRVTIPFVISIFFAISIIYGTDYFWRNIQTQQNIISNQIKPLHIEVVRLINLVYQSQTNLTQYLYLNDPIYEKANREIWLLDISNQKDKIRSLLNGIGDGEAKILFTTLVTQLSAYNQLQQKTEKEFSTTRNPKLVKHTLKTELNNELIAIEKSVNQIIFFIKIQEKNQNQAIENQQIWFYRLLIFSLIVGFLFAYIVGLQMFAGIFKWIKVLRENLKELSYGNLIEPIKVRNNEFKNISNYINRVNENLSLLKDYAIAIGEGNFKKQSKIFGSKSTLGKSINEMGMSLQRVHEAEDKRKWTTEGLAEFAEILRANNHNLPLLCREVINKLVKHLDIIQGGFFILNTEGKPTLELQACYAYGREKFISKQIDINEGLIGRVYHEKERIYLTDIPNNYIEITSGLGSTKPKTLVMLPLVNDEKEIKGVIELASLEAFEEYQLEFLDKLCNSITATISVVINNQKTQKLLEESQKITTSLKVKDEESRTSAEELNQAREEADKKIKQIQKEFENIYLFLDNLVGAVLFINLSGKIEQASPNTERIFGFQAEELVHLHLKILIPNYEMQSLLQINHNTEAGLEEDNSITLEGLKKNGVNLLIQVRSIYLEQLPNHVVILVKEI